MNEPKSRLKAHHLFTDYIYWILVASVPIITASVAICKNSLVWLMLYLAVLILFAVILLRFYCTHCPHYIRGEKVIRCMFFWGVPKYFKQRPGPLKVYEKAVTIIATVIVALLPIYWLIERPEFLIIYIFSIAVLVMTIRRYECCRCIYFDCPSNSVGKPGSEYSIKGEG